MKIYERNPIIFCSISQVVSENTIFTSNKKSIGDFNTALTEQ